MKIRLASLICGIAALVACCFPTFASAEQTLDTRITSSPPNLSRSDTAVFTFESRINEGKWRGCAYDLDLEIIVCQTEFECSLDGEPWTPCRPAVTVQGLSDGYHVFAVRAEDDGATDATPATRLFRVRQTGEECYRALEALDSAERLVEHARYALAIQIEKIEKLKRSVQTAVGRDLVRAQERLREQRVRWRKAREQLRDAGSALELAQVQRGAACSG